MGITHKQIEEIAAISKLEIPKEKIEEIKSSMNQIIKSLDTLKDFDGKGIEPLIQLYLSRNVFREDRIENKENNEEILKNAPDRKDDFFKVPKTVE